MQAGRDLDVLVAKHVMKLPKLRFEEGNFHPNGWVYGQHPLLEEGRGFYVPPYSTDIAAAWDVATKLGQFAIYGPQDDNTWLVLLEGEEGNADTAPLAICLAALKAVDVDIEKEVDSTVTE